MSMDVKQFKDTLLIYGADLNQWPETLRTAGQASLEKSSEFRAIREDYSQFEKVLHSRSYEEPGQDLSQRIITASRHRELKAQSGAAAFLSKTFPEFIFPKPVFTEVSVLIISCLMIGFAIGFLDPLGNASASQDQANLQEFLYYEGEIL